LVMGSGHAGPAGRADARAGLSREDPRVGVPGACGSSQGSSRG
jgi:hypothetical protein